MGENNYTIDQSSYKPKTLTFEKIPYHLWKFKTKGFNLFQRIVVTALASMVAFAFVSLLYVCITAIL